MYHKSRHIAVWTAEAERLAVLLHERGWGHRPEVGEDGYTGYERNAIRLEVAFLARDDAA
ncbi:MAG: hypothetical protein ABJB74_18040 [Gemmatimonas sp.]